MLARVFVAFFLVAISLPSCFWVTTKKEGNTLRQQLTALEDRVGKNESALGGSIEELQEVLEKATKLLRRNSADLGADVESLSKEQARMTGLMEETARQLELLKTELGEHRKGTDERFELLDKAKATTSPNEVFAEGKSAFDSKDYDRSISIFQSFVRNNRQHRLADDSQYYRAKSYARKRDYKSAVSEFQRVYENYPKSDWADDALYEAGEAAKALKWCTDARAYYSVLSKKFPKSRLARKARARERAIKKISKDTQKCTR